MTKKELKAYNFITLGYILFGIICLAIACAVFVRDGFNSTALAYTISSLACAYQAWRRMRILEHTMRKT